MSMTLVALATEVAKSIGGHNTQSVVDVATLAVKQSINDWNTAKNWNFTLRDNSGGFRVTVTAYANTNTVITPVTAGDLDAVNVGVSVTGNNIPASTTVSAVAYGTDNTVSSITLSQAATGAGTVLTFGGYIPIVAGTQDYNLPTDFSAPYAAYLRTAKREISFMRWRDYLKIHPDISSTGPIEGYTLYHPQAAVNQNYGTYRLRLVDVPGQTDSLQLNYYARLNPEATTVQIPDDYLYHLIEYAIWRFILRKNSEDPRLPEMKDSARSALLNAMDNDEATVSEDEDYGLKSQMEAFWAGDRPLFRNGEFYPMDPW